MKEQINKLLQKILQPKKEENQTQTQLSQWVMMKYYAPFKINEDKLIMI